MDRPDSSPALPPDLASVVGRVFGCEGVHSKVTAAGAGHRVDVHLVCSPVFSPALGERREAAGLSWRISKLSDDGERIAIATAYWESGR